MTDHITMICATYDRPLHLEHLIACLKVQTHTDWSMFILQEDTTCKEPGPLAWDGRFARAVVPRNWDWGNRIRMHYAPQAPEGWIGMTNDDNYYAPVYFEKMLETARKASADMVYCDMIHNGLGYRTLVTSPEEGKIDLGAWLARRDLVASTPLENPSYSGADGQFAQALSRRARAVAKTDSILFVHN